LVKSDGTTISAATAGTDYLAPNGNGSALTNLNATNISSGTLAIANGGTGATTSPAARTALGLGTLSTLSAVTSSEITDGTIVDADINGTANINGAKINPAFGAQAVSTTSTLTTGSAGQFVVDATGNITKINNITTSFPATQGTANSVLTNDGAGNLTWATGSGWSLSGNSGTTPGTNFIGTTDAQDLVFKTNSTEYARLTSSGSFAIGTITPIAGSALDVTNSSSQVTAYIRSSSAAMRFVNFGSNFIQSGLNTSSGSQADLHFTDMNASNYWMTIKTGGNIGIGTQTPAAKLDIAGNIKITDGTEGLGKVLTSDATGLATWQNASSGWGLTGNAATNPATQFIGTSDAQDLIFKTNGVERLRINQTAGSNAVVATAIPASGAGQNSYALQGNAINASSLGANVGVYGSSQGGAGAQGVVGEAFGGPTTWGVYGIGYSAAVNSYGVYGNANGSTPTAYGVFAEATAVGNTNYGLFATASGASTNWAAYFSNGNVHITNGLSVGATPGTYGTAGEVLTSAGPGLPPTWSPGSTTTASNGITKTGNDFTLGGALTGETQINRAGSNFILYGAGDFSVRPGGAGTERLFVDGATGNVGIGTTGPSQALDVNGGVIVDHGNTNGGVFVQSQVLQFGVASGEGIGSNRTPGLKSLDFYTNASKRMTISQTGNVGISTSNPPLTPLQIGDNLGLMVVGSDDIISHGIYYDGTNLINRSGNANSAILLGDGKAGIYTFPAGAAAGVASSPDMTFNVRPTGVGIQVDNPIETFQVNGATYLNPITAPGTTTNRLYNVSGNLFWNGINISSGGSGWSSTGNAGTNSTTNFIGTTDNVALRFKTNNITSGLIDPLNSNAFFGYIAGQSTTGTQNVAIGTNAFSANISGSGNVALGTGALQTNSSGTGNIAIGNFADVSSPGLINSIAIGRNAIVGASNSMVLGGTGGDAVNVGIGTTTPTSALDVVAVNKTGISVTTNSVLPGEYAVAGIRTGDGDVAGFFVNNNLASGINAHGVYGQADGQGSGVYGGNNGITGSAATFMNFNGGNPNPVVKIFNNGTGPSLTTAGSVGIGTPAPLSKLHVGAGNIQLDGEQSLLAYNPTDVFSFQSKNVPQYSMGWYQDSETPTLASAWFSSYAGFRLFTNGTQAMRITQNGNVSIGATSAATTAALDIQSTSKGLLIPRLTTAQRDAIPTPDLGLMIYNTSTSAFNYYNGGSWGPVGGGSGWGLTGNAGTNPATNFIGTTDNVALLFKTNNLNSGLIDPLTSSAFFGYRAGESNTASGNAAFGTNALLTNTSGAGNTAFGTSALEGNTTAANNTAFGFRSLASNSTGDTNTGVGSLALQVNTTGFQNTAFGYGSLGNNTTGLANTAIGHTSLFSNINGGLNTALGIQALTANTSGSNNTAVGTTALQTNTTGSGNTVIGYGADVSAGGLTNATAIGYNAKVGASNSLVLGGTGVDAVNVGIGTSTPQSALDVAGQIFGRTGIIAGVPGNGNQQLQMNVGAGFSTIQAINPSVAFNNLALNPSGGNVGIGTTSPIYPLQVNQTALYNSASTHGVYSNPTGFQSSASDLAVGIYSSGAVLAGWFWSFSDARIKEKLSVSNSAEDLKLLMRLKVTDYSHIDKIAKGSTAQKGFIAQEVKEILPDAVNILPQSEFVPSIYSQSKSISKSDLGLRIELSKAHDLKVGDRVRLLDGSVEFKEIVTEIPTLTSFIVKNEFIKASMLFIYGKEISDMHTVDYDRIYTLGVSAIQELNKKLESQQKVIDSLQSQDAENKKKIALLEASLNKVATSEGELASLKSEIEKIKAALGLTVDAALPKKEEKK
ncbi:MAG: hypothetical protein HOP30_06580, partial [Cyclobacteriaceae bacterium]|nr:hypothetical protein [Cyclobacteriaceae bacterium]